MQYDQYSSAAQILATFANVYSLHVLEQIQRNGRISFDEICEAGAPSTFFSIYLDTMIKKKIILYEKETLTYVFNPTMPSAALRLIDALFPVSESADETSAERVSALIDKSLNDPQRSAQLAEAIIAMLLGGE